MKNFTILSFILLIYWNIGFAQNCQTPISTTDFQQIKRNISSQSSLVQKLNTAKNAVQSNCMLSAQIKDILEYFPEDAEKLEIATASYKNTIDKNDFYEIYNSFAYYSTVFRLHDYVLTQKVSNPQNPNDGTENSNNNKPITFPANLFYPTIEGYIGKSNCTIPLHENDFMYYAKQVNDSNGEENKLSLAKNFVNSSCFSTTQLMKISTLLGLEKYRLEFLKFSLPKVYDKDNFKYAIEVMSFKPYQNELLDFINNSNNTPNNTPTQCTISDLEFSKLRKAIDQEISTIDKLEISKALIPPRGVCFTSYQMKTIGNLFSSSIDKLDFAKFGYDYVYDKENYYYEMSSLFISSLDRKSLSNYITSKQKK
jgi:hypothetical protein